jgi:polysaccharide biosynthesis protein PslG
MRSFTVAAVGAILLVAALVGQTNLWAASAALPDPAIPQAIGFNIHITGPDRDLEMIKQAGVRFVRKDLFWSGVERTKGQYDFAEFDRLLDGLDKRGLRVLFILDYGNDKLYPRAEDTEEGRNAYARFAAEAVRHFKGRGVLWELWNEPNVMHFWKGPGDHNSDAFADQYVALLKKAVPAMRQADPDCFILGGSVSCLWVNSFKWLDRCFKQGLLTTGINGLSVHPYGFARPELCINEGYGHLREMMAQYGAPKDFPVVNSEVGYSTADKSMGPPELRLEHQAWHFVRQCMVDQMCGIRLTTWYNWNDDAGHKIAKDDLTPLPIFNACRNMVEELTGYHYVQRMKTESDLDYVLEFENASGRRKLVAWTTPSGRDDTPDTAKAHGFRLPAADASGPAAVRDLYGQPALRSVGDGVMTLDLSGCPQYVEYPGKGPAVPAR